MKTECDPSQSAPIFSQLPRVVSLFSDNERVKFSSTPHHASLPRNWGSVTFEVSGPEVESPGIKGLSIHVMVDVDRNLPFWDIVAASGDETSAYIEEELYLGHSAGYGDEDPFQIFDNPSVLADYLTGRIYRHLTAYP